MKLLLPILFSVCLSTNPIPDDFGKINCGDAFAHVYNIAANHPSLKDERKNWLKVKDYLSDKSVQPLCPFRISVPLKASFLAIKAAQKSNNKNPIDKTAKMVSEFLQVIQTPMKLDKISDPVKVVKDRVMDILNLIETQLKLVKHTDPKNKPVNAADLEKNRPEIINMALKGANDKKNLRPSDGISATSVVEKLTIYYLFLVLFNTHEKINLSSFPPVLHILKTSLPYFTLMDFMEYLKNAPKTDSNVKLLTSHNLFWFLESLPKQ